MRIGTVGIPLDITKVRGIVLSDIPDAPSTIVQPDEETAQMAEHLLNFLRDEVKAGRLTKYISAFTIGCRISSECSFKWLFRIRV